MLPILKLLLFFVLTGAVFIAGFLAYRYFKEKINGSRSLLQLLFYILSLIVVNLGIILLGLLVLLRVYELVSDV